MTSASASRRAGPSKEELRAARQREISDVLRPGLDVVFCGINPGLYSAATGWHFARPGNRFWPVLHRSGFTDRQLHPSEQEALLDHGIGVTNVVARATATAAELSRDELRAGAALLEDKIERLRPRWLAVLGIVAFRTGFGRPGAEFGPQEDPIGGVTVWVLPNPSGLNAHYQIDRLTNEFRELRDAVRAG